MFSDSIADFNTRLTMYDITTKKHDTEFIQTNDYDNNDWIVDTENSENTYDNSGDLEKERYYFIDKNERMCCTDTVTIIVVILTIVFYIIITYTIICLYRE